MLLQFRFNNYKSFRDETIFDMSATTFKEHSYSLLKLREEEKILPLGVIYGANASGKSNFIKAFSFMRDFVISSLVNDNEQPMPIPVESFKFMSDNLETSSEFEVFFFTKETEYQYGFILNKQRIFEEWLYFKPKKNKERVSLFRRYKDEIKFNSNMKQAEIFKDFIDEKTLFLSLTNKTNIEASKDVVQWFRSTIVINYGNTSFERVMNIRPILMENKEYILSLESFLKAIDVRISGLILKENETVKPKEEKDFEVYTKHNGIDGKEYFLLLEQESDGTKKMFCLYNFIYMTLQSGRILFIDELNAKLHPLLVRYIINMFRDPQINKNNAQLIFTTHDVSILSKDIFRRDEIWFTELTDSGTSILYSLSEYKIDDKKVRNDASFSKDYLSGRYGAIPIFKEFDINGDINGQ